VLKGTQKLLFLFHLISIRKISLDVKSAKDPHFYNKKLVDLRVLLPIHFLRTWKKYKHHKSKLIQCISCKESIVLNQLISIYKHEFHCMRTLNTKSSPFE
jgi:hypothetical protein